MTEWLAGWKAHNWRNSRKEEVLNRDLWERLDEACKEGYKERYIDEEEGNKVEDNVGEME